MLVIGVGVGDVAKVMMAAGVVGVDAAAAAGAAVAVVAAAAAAVAAVAAVEMVVTALAVWSRCYGQQQQQLGRFSLLLLSTGLLVLF